jgi:hypothetical protein
MICAAYMSPKKFNSATFTNCAINALAFAYGSQSPTENH